MSGQGGFVHGRPPYDSQRPTPGHTYPEFPAVTGASNGSMDAEKIIAEIETLEQMFALADPRPLGTNDIAAINRRHDERLAHNPWFQLWNTYMK